MARTRTLTVAAACATSVTVSMALLASGSTASATPDRLSRAAHGSPSDVAMLSAKAGNAVRPAWPAGTFDGIAESAGKRGTAAAPKPASPADGSTLADRSPVLTAARIAGNAEYEFVIGTGDSPRGGQVVSSGWLRTPRWTVPDGLLKDGGQYQWTVRARNRASGKVTADATARSLTVNLRLGAQSADGPVPTDTLGPVSVNLANGNATTSVATPQTSTATGTQAATFTYNSLATAEVGLTGSYFTGTSEKGIGGTEKPAVVRTDTQPSFRWDGQAPWEGAEAGDRFRVRWTGQLRVPDSGGYRLGGVYQGGVRIWLDGTLVVDDWTGEKGGATPRFGTTRQLKAGHAYAVRIEYQRPADGGQVALWAQRTGKGSLPVPSSWLAPAGSVLPPGWSVTPAATGPDGVSAVKEGTGEGVAAADGAAGTHAADPLSPQGADTTGSGTGAGTGTGTGTGSAAGAAQSPAALAKAAAGAKGAEDTDADSDAAELKAAEEAADEGLTFSYAGDSTCEDDDAPEGFVCAVKVPGAGTTQLYYSAGKLARIVNPGEETTDFGYSADHRLTAVRTPLVMDWIAVDPDRRDHATANYQVGYGNSDTRATRLAGPEPTGFTEGRTARPERRYGYASGSTTIDVAGLKGTRTVAYDSAGRVSSDTDATGRTVRTEWTAAEQPASTLDAAGRLTTTVYDEAGRPVGTFGPGPRTCFADDGRLVSPAPSGCAKVPATTTAYGDTSVTTVTAGSDGVPDVTVERRLNELGVPVASVTDPTGWKLTTGYEYDEMFRPTAKVMPSGAKQSYAYYGATEKADNPCTDEDDPLPQAGLPKSITSAASATGSSRVEKFVYDERGLPVAVTFGGTEWTCVDYGDRGQIRAMHVPGNDWAPARTITYDTAYGGDPLTTKASEPGDELLYTVDLLGRTVRFTDAQGIRTETVYDRAGRAVRETSTPAGDADAAQVKTVRYDDAGRKTAVALDGKTLATVSLDAGGEVERVTYANGSSLKVARDAAGRITGKDWKPADGRSLSSTVTRARSGVVTDESTAGKDAREGEPNYRYDASGRLVDAWVTGHHYSYDFADAPKDCPEGTQDGAGRNGDRLRLTDRTADGTTETGYCYDAADRLLATTGAHPVTDVTYAANGHMTGYRQDGATVEQRHDAGERYLGSGITGKDAADVRYTSDIADHLIERAATGADGSTQRYGHTSHTDPDIDFVLDEDKRVLSRVVSLPGGVVYAKAASSEGRSTWSYPTVRGDVFAVAGDDGKQVGDLYQYGPYGEPLTADGTVDPDHVPDNLPGDFDYGWLGQYQRGSEHAGALFSTVLDTRLLNNPLGRFTQPVSDGPFLNAYEYAAGDPVNHVSIDGFSLDGEKE
ncbi:PA14 domain-containing protein [Streptomyces sp. S465]|uniref:PA14 domain-containing protein n=1 Tax=Streptomyces sp. S465 TaxID=2979468 RepID=UPI0022A8272B|nr:PA14 domain-containing protein [Streptomyces sp. S465]WAP56770.1 PA14 domain-containing protein [Streptomyces sp. S465]